MRRAAQALIALLLVTAAYCFARAESSATAEGADEAQARADATAKLAKVELDKALESNRQTPGSVSDAEIERLKARYRKLVLAENGRAAISRVSDANAKVSRSEYEKALQANRQTPGAITQENIDRAHNQYQDDAIQALQDQVTELREELAGMRKELIELRKSG